MQKAESLNEGEPYSKEDGEPAIECTIDEISTEKESIWRFRVKDLKGTIYEAKGNFPAYIMSTQVHLHALKEACRFITRSIPPQTDVKFYVKNQNTLKRLFDNSISHITVRDTVQALEELCKSRKVILIAGETLAMRGEVEATLLHNAPREATLPIAKSSFKRGTRLLCQYKWAERWAALNQCRQTKLWILDIQGPPKPRFQHQTSLHLN